MIRTTLIPVCIPFGLALAFLLISPMATAQEGGTVSDADREKAVQFYEEAVQLYKEGKTVESARKLEEAYALDPNPVLAYNIGKAYDDAARFEPAKKWYREALAGQLAEEERRKATKALERIEKTEAELAAKVEEMQPSDARLQVSSNADGAIVFIDGKQAGETPYSKVINPGSYTVRVEAEGREPYSEVVEMAAGDTILVRAALAAPPQASLMPWVWATAGVGVAGLALAIPTDIIANDTYDEAEGLRDNPDALQDKKDKGKTMQALAITGYSLAGAAFIASSVLLIIELTADEEDSGLKELSQRPWSIGVNPTGATLSVSW